MKPKNIRLTVAERKTRDLAIAEMRRNYRIIDVAEHFGVCTETVVRACRGSEFGGLDLSDSVRESARAGSARLLAALSAHHVPPQQRPVQDFNVLPLRLRGSPSQSMTGSPASMCPEIKGL